MKFYSNNHQRRIYERRTPIVVLVLTILALVLASVYIVLVINSLNGSAEVIKQRNSHILQ